MRDFHFASPVFLYALPALAVVFLVLRRLGRNAEERLSRFLSPANLQQLLKGRASVSERGKRAAFWLGLALAVLALARPQANPTVEEMQSTGLDIYVVLDVSRSMDCEDVAPSRLKKAKRTVQHLTARLSGDRVGLIAFAKSSVLVSPLTNDYSILDSYLQNIDTNVIPSQGTNMGAALEVAREAMARGAKNNTQSQAHTNIFLVMSDGEDHGQSDLGVVDEIRKNGGLVFTIAFGTEKGAPIPAYNDRGERVGFHKDRSGQIVVTTVKTAALAEAAKRGGGQFYHSTQDEAEVEDILARVGDAQRGSYATIRTTVWEEFFWMFLAPSLALLLFSFVPLRSLVPFAKETWMTLGRIRRPGGKTAVIVLLALGARTAQAGPISFFWNQERKASDAAEKLAKEKKFGEAADSLKPLQAENPDHPEVNYDIGTYLLADKQGKAGREQLSHLRNAEGALRDLGQFNVAGSYALEGQKAEARAAYAELIQRLQRKSKLTDLETKLLADARRNVARLADPSQAPQPQPDQKQPQDSQQSQDQNKGGSGDQKQDQKQGQGGEQKQDGKQGQGDDKKDQKKGDQKDGKQGEGDDKKDKDKSQGDEKKDSNKQQGDDKDKDKDKKGQGDQKQDDKQGPGDKNKQQPGPQGTVPLKGGHAFKDRENMGEDEARQILGALKERESDLQKKLLKNQVKGGKVNDDDDAQDW